MQSMYALRISRFVNGKPSGKPDGMFVRKDGLMTDHKANALLFGSEDQAFDYGVKWKATSGVKYEGRLFVVEATVKPILHVVVGVKCTLD